MESSQVVLEEVMRATILAAQRAKQLAAAGDRHAAGQVFAYHDVLSVLREQADLAGIEFDDRLVAEFDPDELIAVPGPSQAAA